MSTGAEGITHAEKYGWNYKPCKGWGEMISDERGNVHAIGKEHDTSPAKSIGHKAAGNFQQGPENKAYGIQDAYLGIAKSFILKEYQYEEEFKEPLVLEKTVQTEFIVLPVFGKGHIRVL